MVNRATRLRDPVARAQNQVAMATGPPLSFNAVHIILTHIMLTHIIRAGQRTERRGATTHVQFITPPPSLENSTDFGHFKNASQGITRKKKCTVLGNIYIDIAHC